MKFTIETPIFFFAFVCLSFLTGQVFAKPIVHFHCLKGINTYVPDLNDCAVYYNCQNGVVMDTMHCGAGNIFHPQLVQCVEHKDAPFCSLSQQDSLVIGGGEIICHTHCHYSI